MTEIMALVCGKIRTMEDSLPVCDGILMEGGKITALGGSDEIKRRFEELAPHGRGELIDLRGKTAVPGLHDCHVHIMGTGLNSLGIDMYDCSDVAGALEKLRADEGSGWVFGKRLDESRLKEKRPPTMSELDSAVPDRPAYIVDRGWHYTLVNSTAFKQFGLSADVPGVRLGDDGKPNGRLHEQANSMAKMSFFNMQDEASRAKAFRYTATLAASKGCTTIHGMEGGSLFSDSDIPVLLAVKDVLDVHVALYWAIEDEKAVIGAGLAAWGGDITLDGSIGSRTAAFSEQYDDAPGTFGTLYYSDRQVRSLIRRALDANLQIAFHAIGQKAIRQALDCYELELAGERARQGQLRIEHFGFPAQGDIDLAGRLGVVVSSQPSFTFLRGGPGTVYRSRLGEARERGGYPHRRMLDAGIVIGGGSDSDVTPIDPLLGMHAAVNPPYPENAVTPKEALEMFTSCAALIAGEQDIKGTLAVGKLGDLSVLNDDPLLVPGHAIRDIGVSLTIKEGQITYGTK
ncbi:MAG: amidohydrolase [Synergistaceae bacterium]|jgi:predicted amidohydrolase YtcJ|nr:amidohydrolase [Synergistaceae bacterium]